MTINYINNFSVNCANKSSAKRLMDLLFVLIVQKSKLFKDKK